MICMLVFVPSCAFLAFYHDVQDPGGLVNLSEASRPSLAACNADGVRAGCLGAEDDGVAALPNVVVDGETGVVLVGGGLKISWRLHASQTILPSNMSRMAPMLFSPFFCKLAVPEEGNAAWAACRRGMPAVEAISSFKILLALSRKKASLLVHTPKQRYEDGVAAARGPPGGLPPGRPPLAVACRPSALPPVPPARCRPLPAASLPAFACRAVLLCCRVAAFCGFCCL